MYEYCTSMGTVEEARGLYDRGLEAYDRGLYSSAAALFAQAYSESPHPTALTAQAGSLARAGQCSQARSILSQAEREGAGADRVQLVSLDIDECTPGVTSGGAQTLRPSPFDNGEAPSATTTTVVKSPEEPSWTEGISSMYQAVASKLGIGQQADGVAQQAQQAAIQAASEVTGRQMPEFTPQQAPQVQIEESTTIGDLAPWLVGGTLAAGFVGVGIWLIVRK